MQIFNDVIFGNVGKKIKTLAIVLFVVGIFGSAIVGIMLQIEEDYGIAVWIVGTLVSWIASLLTYGQGELIDKATQIAENTENEK